MQRKNSILKTSHAKRGGFAMIMAVSVIVIVATILALSMTLTNKTTKKTVDLYVYEQAVLLSKSATEYALLEISKSAACSWPTTFSDANFKQDNFYDINISVMYIYDNAATCTAGGGNSYFVISTPEQSGSVLLDVTVSVNDTSVTTEPIRFFRRSIQKL